MDLSLQSKFLFAIFVVFPLFFNYPKASSNQIHKETNNLLNSCYQDISFCNDALIKINNHQKKSVMNKNFPCQTRLLGLEANLIMAMNANFKKNEVKSIIDSVKKYC